METVSWVLHSPKESGVS